MTTEAGSDAVVVLEMGNTQNSTGSNDSLCKEENQPTTRNPVKVIGQDLKFLAKGAPMKHMEFDFMRNDTHPLVPLQDWSSDQWAKQFSLHTSEAVTFLKNFFPSADIAAELTEERCVDAAVRVTQKLNGALLTKEWRLVLAFQNEVANVGRNDLARVYLDNSLRAQLVFDRDFPLGVEEHMISNKNKQLDFALAHSGVSNVVHSDNKCVAIVVYSIIIAGVLFTIYMIASEVEKDMWNLKATTINTTDPENSSKVLSRTKDRAFVASMFATLGFSLTINASIDKFGKIDPSTSTVLIGMTMGNTVGFVLDNMLGVDAGFREYLWSSMGGMKYAIASLATARFARYLVTVLFDMFFTVILFKRLYSFIVRMAGFSVNGREWIANGMSSTIISFLTFKVYANMTRLEWAYPSGVEDVRNQWISGANMVLAVVTMSIVYLIDESRTSFGERGINDPPVKIVVVLLTFCLLVGLQTYNVADPSNLVSHHNSTVNANFMDYNLPLDGVCEAEENFASGMLIFLVIVTFCLGFVIFVTSQQTVRGLCDACCGCVRKPQMEQLEDEPKEEPGSMKAKLLLFAIYFPSVLGILAFFTFIPLWYADGTRNPLEPC